MPCPFTGPKMFCAGPNYLSQPKNLTAFSGSSKTLVPAQETILLNTNHRLVWHKKFDPAQKFLGPVKGQGIRFWPKEKKNLLLSKGIKLLLSFFKSSYGPVK